MSTSKLQRKTGDALWTCFHGFSIKENLRPEWLQSKRGERLELDFYMEELAIAVEVQGAQHYVFSPPFHATYDDFISQVRRDEEKRAICERDSITLIYVDNDETLQECLAIIRSRIKEMSADKVPVLFTSYRRRRFERALRLLKKCTPDTPLNKKVNAMNMMRDNILFFPDEFEVVFDRPTRDEIMFLMDGCWNSLVDYRAAKKAAKATNK